MDLRQYLYLLRKWFWLLILGGIVGAGIAYFVSTLQPTVYQTRTKFMVMSSPEERASNYYYSYNENQLAKSYSQMLATDQVLDPLSETLGFNVRAGQLNISPVADSSIIEIEVRDTIADRTALIANTMIDVFIEYNAAIQESRFAESEQSLQSQIAQVESQIEELQSEMSSEGEKTFTQQKQLVEVRIAELEAQIKPIRRAINAILPTVTPPLPPEPGYTFLGDRLVQATPVPTATYSPAEHAFYTEQLSLLEDNQYKLEQLQSTLDLYQEINLNLEIFGESDLTGSSNDVQGQLQDTLALYQQIYTNLLNSYENTRLARLRSTPNIIQIEDAGVPNTPIQPQPMRNAALGAVAGILIMGAVAVLIEYLDDTIKTPEDVNRTLNLPVIGLIAEMEKNNSKDDSPGVFVVEHPRSPISEAFRTLRSNLEFAGVDQPLKSILISSSAPSEGKTTIAVNLAAVMAQGEKNVVLVDADMRRPSVHKFMKVPNRDGLSAVFRNPEQFAASLAEPWGSPSISIITSGALPPNPTELLASDTMNKTIDDLKSAFDMVILDGPPFIVADPVVLSAKVDGVLLIIEPGSTKIDAAQAMLEQLKRAGANVVGVVLNPISRKRAGYYSGKYRYYSDYYSSGGYGYYSSKGSRRRASGRWPTKPKTAGSQAPGNPSQGS